MPVIPIDDDDDFDDWDFDDESKIDDVALHESTKQHQGIITVPTHHPLDFEHLKTYIYPTNLEIRDYQYNIIQRAFYDNLLVALPTGLGKTFIASTVMLNFLRWFPESKLIFMAPTKPLVAQQIKACCSITGIPSSKVAILLDKSRLNRQDIWDTHQVFFTTPQVVENDLARGIVNPKSVVLLVIDEAHRARGNYSYNNVVKFLTRFNQSFRILALTATPASDVDGVQDIIDNLKISKVELRTENSIDIFKYIKQKKIVRRTITPSNDIKELIDLIAKAIAPVLATANERGILEITDPTRINHFQCMEASKKVTMNKTLPEGLKWSNFFMLQLLGTVGQCYKRLNIYGIKSFYNYFNEKYQEFTKKKSKNKLNVDFYSSVEINQVLERSQEMIKSGYSHPKIEALMDELGEFFQESSDDSRVIIFTEYRESALEIVQCIERNTSFKPHIFIGQAKEKNSTDGKSKTKKNSDGPTRTSSEDAQIKGMNQKLQKQIIKDFKSGTYNILVATSIGEEGLDIGEVDLIICYDSTSSPIKSIQRMGRTGRKRDGKIILLFSGNEETKFNKAMDGYEYIQQHIQRNELIQLCPRNRIIPDIYTPKIVEQFIEIPIENIELKNEDDEDEIIRIATQYMLGGNSKKKTKKKKQEKTTKKFFMPDNVETGFQSVTSMIKKSRKRDVLDSFLDSSSDDDLEVSNSSLKKRKVPNSSPNCSKGSIKLVSNAQETSRLNSSPGSRQDPIDLSDSDEDRPISQLSRSAGSSSNEDCRISELSRLEDRSISQLSRLEDRPISQLSRLEDRPISQLSRLSGSNENHPSSEGLEGSNPKETYFTSELSKLEDTNPLDSNDDFSFSSSDEEVLESIRAPTPLQVNTLSKQAPGPKQLKKTLVPEQINDKEINGTIAIPKANSASSKQLVSEVVPLPKPTSNSPLPVPKPVSTSLKQVNKTRPNTTIDHYISSTFNPGQVVGRPKKTLGLKRIKMNKQLTPPVVQTKTRPVNDSTRTIPTKDSTKVVPMNGSSKNIPVNDPIYEYNESGLLTSEEKIQLYTNYYSSHQHQLEFYDPSKGLNRGNTHSSTVLNLIKCLNVGVIEPTEIIDESFDFSFIIND
ncbi:ATP-dependent DNA helicase MPH1 [Spathaspora sp. JA1]|nr:ATP-dependent DNA helicase MPH1 [Spathaspora sp. JA1]